MTRPLPPALRADLELLPGAGFHRLVHDPVSGRYHRLSPAAADLLPYLDGTRTAADLTALVAAGRGGPVGDEVDAFLAELDAAGLLGGDAGERPRRARRRRWRPAPLVPRLELVHWLPRLLEPPAAVLRRVPARLAAGAPAVLAVVGVGFGVWTALRSPVDPGGVGAGIRALAVAVLLVQVVGHELAHALVCQVLRVPVRAAGVGLLMWCVPVAYVDRTDAYRLRTRTGPVAIALAGVCSDGIAIGIAALTATAGGGPAAQVAPVLLVLQLAMLAVNLNPLLPGDGVTALQSAFGPVDHRGRALLLLRSAVLRRPLPPTLARLPGSRRIGYLAYAVACAAYVLTVAGLAAGVILRAVTAR